MNVGKTISCITENARPGMILAKGVTAPNGKALAQAGDALTASQIELLKCRGVSVIDICCEVLDPQPVANEYVFTAPEESWYEQSLTALRESFQVTHHTRTVEISLIKQIAVQNLAQISGAAGLPSLLHRPYSPNCYEEYIAGHSINVAIIAGSLGKGLGFDRKMQQELVLAGLLHDIGKTRIPSEILMKTHCLTSDELEFIELHPTFGYEMIRSSVELSDRITICVLTHHERLDGTGYPHRLSGAKIDAFTRVIMLADIYESLIGERTYRNALTPGDALNELSMIAQHGKVDLEMALELRDNLHASLIS